MAHGKRFRKAAEKVQSTNVYSPAEGIALLKQVATANFDETVELKLRLGLNVRHAEEQLRGTLALPHGLGKEVKIAVFAQGQQARGVVDLTVHQDDRANRGITQLPAGLQHRRVLQLGTDIRRGVAQNPVAAAIRQGYRGLGTRAGIELPLAQTVTVTAIAVPLRKTTTCSRT